MQTLMDVLVNISLVQGKDDSFAWKHDVWNDFSIKSFSLQVQNAIFRRDHLSRNIVRLWRGLAPLRVEILVWFVHLQRLNTRHRLCKLKILNLIQAICPLCRLEVETVNYLFFSCIRTWKLWSSCLLWWNSKAIFPMMQVLSLTIGLVFLSLDERKSYGFLYTMLVLQQFGSCEIR